MHHGSVIRQLGALAIGAVLTLGLASSASAQNLRARGGQVTIPASSIERPTDIGRRAHTNIKLFTPTGGLPKAVPAVVGPPFSGYLFETPASIACIYNLVPQANG